MSTKKTSDSDAGETWSIVKVMAYAAIAFAVVRAAEWVIPAPEGRILICMESDVMRIEACKMLSEIKREGAK